MPYSEKVSQELNRTAVAVATAFHDHTVNGETGPCFVNRGRLPRQHDFLMVQEACNLFAKVMVSRTIVANPDLLKPQNAWMLEAERDYWAGEMYARLEITG